MDNLKLKPYSHFASVSYSHTAVSAGSHRYGVIASLLNPQEILIRSRENKPFSLRLQIEKFTKGLLSLLIRSFACNRFPP